MTSIEIADATAEALRAQADREGLSLDALLRRRAVFESVPLHNEILGEPYVEDAEAERLTD